MQYQTLSKAFRVHLQICTKLSIFPTFHFTLNKQNKALSKLCGATIFPLPIMPAATVSFLLWFPGKFLPFGERHLSTEITVSNFCCLPGCVFWFSFYPQIISDLQSWIHFAEILIRGHEVSFNILLHTGASEHLLPMTQYNLEAVAS